MQESLSLLNTTLVVTLRCNLHCRLCAVSAPYYEEPPHYSFENLTGGVAEYFKAVDRIEKFTINGGEPLLHPQLPEIMESFEPYMNKIGMLEIITNGSIAPTERLLKALQFSTKIDILIDDYGKELSKNVQKIIDAFKVYGIKYRHRKYYGDDAHCGGWVDLLDLSKKQRSSSETEQIYKHCAYPGPFHCFVLFDRKAYICGVYKRCETLGIIPDIPDDYISFVDDSIPVSVKKEQIRNFYNRKYFAACEYCSGFCDDSPRFAPAEQLEKPYRETD
ncbi:MAG: radical SAM protein [Dysgonamonadaceae bacterium]|jgi:organic radical activating enzyme|nr:radical SAM protein [Dysgonamonadaceae bacterium]